jgi:NaMN:DMB phosphoribosyltransferase
LEELASDETVDARQRAAMIQTAMMGNRNRGEFVMMAERLVGSKTVASAVALAVAEGLFGNPPKDWQGAPPPAPGAMLRRVAGELLRRSDLPGGLRSNVEKARR